MAHRVRSEFLGFISSYPRASAWMAQYDLLSLLDDGGGIVKISNFLPDQVALGILDLISNVPTGRWNWTAAHEDYKQNNIKHEFWSLKQTKHLDSVARVFSLLLPENLHTFSAARYDEGHHIEPHDDRAYTQVLMQTGEVVTCSRDIAVIYYLTKDWKEEYGGTLIDIETGRRYVPEFNSAIMFRIPRWHEVTKVVGNRPRFSIFGWFLQPGKLYDLNIGKMPKRAPTPCKQGVRHEGQQRCTKRRRVTVAAESDDSAPPGVQAAQQQNHHNLPSTSHGKRDRVHRLQILPAPTTARFRIRGRHPVSIRVGKRLWCCAAAGAMAVVSRGKTVAELDSVLVQETM